MILSPAPLRRTGRRNKRNLVFLNGHSVSFTDFNAALTAETFFAVDNHGFTVFHLKYFHRTDVHTLFAAHTFVSVNRRCKTHVQSLLKKIIIITVYITQVRFLQNFFFKFQQTGLFLYLFFSACQHGFSLISNRQKKCQKAMESDLFTPLVHDKNRSPYF